jgi:phage terminase large subunit
MPTVTIPANGWRPRPYQMPAWAAFERGIKRNLLVWHRRAGKDELSLNKACVAAHPDPLGTFANARIANYWHCLPMYEQARKAIWEAINPHSGKRRIDEAFPREIRARTDNSSMTIEFKSGSIWRVVGSDNPDSLVGAPPFGLVFSEWALCNPSAWGLLQPILLENGGWADFITTPRGRNHVRSMLEMARKNANWFAQVLTVDDTHQVTLDQIEEARKEYESLYGKEAADALIQQEYWCSFEAAILGAYWGKELAAAEQQGRINANVEAEPDVPVHTAWDLGIDDAMAIWWWQPVAGQIRWLDYYEAHGYAIPHYAEVIKKKAEDRGWVRGTDYVPHDAKQREMTSSGKDGKAKQRIEVMIECGLKPKVVPQHNLMDGISAVRQILGRSWWHIDHCDDGLNAARSYQTEWDDDNKVFRRTPLHNWASHGADAKRTAAMAYREMTPKQEPPPGRMLTIGDPSTLPPGVGQVTLNDLWSMQKRGSKRI